jgi:hypothetical protein
VAEFLPGEKIIAVWYRAMVSEGEPQSYIRLELTNQDRLFLSEVVGTRPPRRGLIDPGPGAAAYANYLAKEGGFGPEAPPEASLMRYLAFYPEARHRIGQPILSLFEGTGGWG